ncbi:MAG: FAD-dependent oxidoreductase [Desulfomonilaceae bacterium]
MNKSRSIVIIGGGVAGLAVAEALAENDLPCVIVEKEESLGGHVKNWACTATHRCLSCYCCKVDDLVHTVRSSDKITVELGWEVSQLVRNGSKIEKVGLRSTGDAAEKFVDACAVVAAVGFAPYDPSDKFFWGYGRLNGVVTLAELNQWARSGDLSAFVSDESQPLRLAFFQCIGSRDRTIGANYCSEYCCGAALRMALSLRYTHPHWDVALFYIDLQMAGKMANELMKAAQKQGIRLVQGVPGEILQGADISLSVVRTKDGLNAREEFDRIVLSVGQRPAPGIASLAEILGLSLDQFGFISVPRGLRGCRAAAAGVYVAGTCGGPANIQKTLLSAGDAAAAIIADYSSL